MTALSNDLQNSEGDIDDDLTTVTGFNTIDSLLNYLNYKRYDRHFLLKFLEETRFMPNH